MVCWPMLGPDHCSFSQPPPPALYSSYTSGTFVPPVSEIEPELIVHPRSTHWLTRAVPFTWRRSPSSELAKNVYVPVVGTVSQPDQRRLTFVVPSVSSMPPAPVKMHRFPQASPPLN